MSDSAFVFTLPLLLYGFGKIPSHFSSYVVGFNARIRLTSIMRCLYWKCSCLGIWGRGVLWEGVKVTLCHVEIRQAFELFFISLGIFQRFQFKFNWNYIYGRWSIFCKAKKGYFIIITTFCLQYLLLSTYTQLVIDEMIWNQCCQII